MHDDKINGFLSVWTRKFFHMSHIQVSLSSKRCVDNLNIFKSKQFSFREHFHFRIIKLGVKCQSKHFSHSRYLVLVFEQF